MSILAGLVVLLLPAVPCFGQSQQQGTNRLPSFRTNRTPQAVTRDSEYLYKYATDTSYWQWHNQIAMAAIGFGGTTGSFGFGSWEGDPNRYGDEGLADLNRSTSFLYIDNGGGQEIQVGAGGLLLEQADVDIRTHSGSYLWRTMGSGYNFTVAFKMWLVRDVMRYRFEITNNNPNTVRLGFRTAHDLTWGVDKDLNPITSGTYFVPGSNWLAEVQQYTDANVPSKWFVRQSLNVLQPESPPLLRYSEILSGDGVTTPSRFVMAPETIMSKYTWMQILKEAEPQNENTPSVIQPGIPFAVDDQIQAGLYYPIESLAYGQTRTITGEFKLDWATVNTIENQYALALSAPDYLNYRTGDNPNTPEVEQGYIDPSTFALDAYVFNSSLNTEPLASMAIDLGKGLELDPTIQPQPVDSINGIVVDHKYTWTLRANGEASGSIPVTVTTFLNPGGTITTTRYINVPALANVSSINLERAPHFTGFPFTFSNPDAMKVLTNVNNAVGPGFEVAWWDPTMPGYRYARPVGATDGLTLQPGRGYWLKIPDSAPTLTNAVPLVGATPVAQDRAYTTQLERGWNAISNPFQFSINWGYCFVIFHNQQYTIADAIKTGLIRREMWVWDPTNQQYSPPTNPYPVTDLWAELRPAEGYWLFATGRMYLVFTPNQFLPPMGGRTLAAAKTLRTPGSATQWHVDLLVSTSKGKSHCTVGVSPTDLDGMSNGDMMAPPIGPSGLMASIPRQAWGQWAANYAADIQAPGNEKSWPLEVQCDQPNEQVVLRWPDLTQLPARMPLVLTDELTGQQIAMRTAPSYTFNSGQGGVRRFTITAGGLTQALRITSTQVQRTTRNAGTLINCGLSIPAQVTLRIRNTSGRLIRTLGPMEVSGQGAISWDGRDEQGRLLPAGIYLGELYAEASDGQRIRAIVTINTRN